jgi:hypothetical protein
MSRFHNLSILLLLAFTLYSAVSHAAEPASVVGNWKGVVFIKPAEQEVEIEVSFSREDNGALAGRLSFTTNGDFNRPIHSLSIEGTHLRFAVTDDEGIVSSFDGWLSEDGAIVTGDLKEQNAHYVFNLHRIDIHNSASVQPALRRLSRNGDEIRELFNHDSSCVRILLILSSACPICKSSMGVVQRYVLDEIKAPDLRVYVIWEPVVARDTEETATAASRFMSDPRVVQFWGENRFAGQAFANALTAGAAPVWDVFFIFSGGARWETVVPTPSFIMSNMPGEQPLRKYPRLNGPELALKIKSLLGKDGSMPVGRPVH